MDSGGGLRSSDCYDRAGKVPKDGAVSCASVAGVAGRDTTGSAARLTRRFAACAALRGVYHGYRTAATAQTPCCTAAVIRSALMVGSAVRSVQPRWTTANTSRPGGTPTEGRHDPTGAKRREGCPEARRRPGAARSAEGCSEPRSRQERGGETCAGGGADPRPPAEVFPERDEHSITDRSNRTVQCLRFPRRPFRT